MSIKEALVDKIIVGVAAAATLGGGGTILSNWYKNGQQDILIEQSLQIRDTLSTIESKIDMANSINSGLVVDVNHIRKEQDRIRDKLEVKEEPSNE